MHRSPMTYMLSALLSLSGAFANTGEPQNGPINCSASEIGKQCFQLGDLKLTLDRFDGFTSIHVENTSTQFFAFSVGDLVAVGSDHKQLVAQPRFLNKQSLPPSTVRIAPGAHAEIECVLFTGIKLPAKFYFQEKFVAIVSK